ncbi:MAG: hypothetical protein ABI611_02660 [Solirubrobacteraceae bacterium]
MVPSLRHAAGRWTLLALAGTALIAWMGLQGFAFSDYDREAAPAYLALAHGSFGEFLSLSPAYGGSLIMRAPFAMLPDLWGGGELAVFRAAAVPGLAAGIALGLVLAAQNLARGLGRGTAAMVLLLCAGNPITWRAVEMGHPEELLGGVLCVGAVLAGLGRKPGWAGLLLGLAIANKAWAVLAIGPVLLALPAGRWRALAIAGGIAFLFTLPLLLAAPATATPGGANASGVIFHPWQVWWFFGNMDLPVPGPDPRIARSAPAWLSPIPHPLIVALAIPLSLLAARRKADPLALLALLLLLRCVLDPWNNTYYVLPCVLALAAWEPMRYGRPPLLALATVVATFISMERIFDVAPLDVVAASYLVWSLPLALFLGWRIYAPAALAAVPTLSSGGRASVWSTTQ